MLTVMNFKCLVLRSVLLLVVATLLYSGCAYAITMYTSYQSEIVCIAANSIAYPATTAEVQQIVRNAISSNTTVKAFGARHSVLDTICTSGTPIDIRKINYVNVDTDSNIVRAGAGAQLADFVAKLKANGQALIGQVPSFGGVTIGGALGTGARGSSLLHATSLSDQLIAVKLVDGVGNIRIVDESTPEDLSAFKVHLGLLGVLVEASFRTVTSYKMKVSNYRIGDDILFDGSAIEKASKSDWFQMWWFPNTKSVIVSERAYVSKETRGNASTYNIPEVDELTAGILNNAFEVGQAVRTELVLGSLQVWSELSLYRQVPLRSPVFSEDGGVTLSNPAIGYAQDLMQNRCKKCAWKYGPGKSVNIQEFAVALDISKFAKAVQGIRDILSLQGAAFPIYGIFIRFAPESTAVMSVEYGRKTVHIEIVTPMRRNPFTTSRSGLGAVQAIEQLLIELGGRPHWSMCGQLFHTKSMLQRNSPNIAQFRTMMSKYDPNGVFLNNFGKRITGASSQLTIDSRVRHCALQDGCICTKDTDCASGQICGKLYGYNVCKDFLAEVLPLNVITSVTDVALKNIGNLFSVL